MLKQISAIGNEGITITIGQAFSFVGSLVLVRILTEYLTPEQYGKLALALTISALVNQVVVGGIKNGIMRYYPIAVSKKSFSSYYIASKHIYLFSLIILAIIGALLLITIKILDLKSWFNITLIALLYSLFIGANSVMIDVHNAARNRIVYAIHTGAESWLKIFYVILLVEFLNPNSKIIIIGYLMAVASITLSLFLNTNKLFRAHFQEYEHKDDVKKWRDDIWKYSWPFCAWGIFTWIHQVSDRWILEGLISTEAVGKYVVVYQLGYSPIIILPGVLVTIIAPILFERTGDASNSKDNESVHNVTWRITFLTLFITIIAVLVSLRLEELLFSLLVAEEYRSISYLLPWVILAGGVFASGQVLSLKIMSELRSKSMLSVKIVTAAIGVIANYILTMIFGLNGMIVGLNIFSVVYFMWIGYIAYKSKI